MNNKQVEYQEFEKLLSYIERLQSRYFRALSAFYAYEGLREISAPNVVGKAVALDNVKVLDRYRNFFVSAQEALRTYFFIELAKMFDNSDEALHINKIINYANSTIKNLTVEAFKEHNKDRRFLKELIERYRGISNADLNDMRKMLEKQKSNIKKLKIYRDKWLAHDEAEKPEPPGIGATDIKALFDLLKKILNTISSKLNDESWAYSHVESNAKTHVYSIIKHLKNTYDK